MRPDVIDLDSPTLTPLGQALDTKRMRGEVRLARLLPGVAVIATPGSVA